MPRRWLIALFVVAAAAAFAAGRFSVRPQAGFDPARDLQPARIASLLALSEAQAAQVTALGSDYETRVQEVCAAHCAARCQLAHAFQQDQVTSEEMRRLIQRMCASQQENDMATLEHVLKVREILTPEQRATFADNLAACLCETCGGRGETRCGSDNTEEQP